ncbi:acetamidase/formamidase family protein [Peptoniphilus catoniae]|uniref:acetamidase/formamidase family protein n=1 Tax=Peptoniphilus catoniae TaxID=1660341 RepID=UPI001C5A3DD1|nr:acetamidase/formamidase family protein [Peptoniphilus catoniae]
MKILKENIIFAMDKNNKPAMKAKSGDEVIFETCDCFTDAIKTEEDLVSGIDFSRVNPATGPLYVEDAKPGDVLKVDIIKIDLMNKGVSVATPGLGRIGQDVKAETTMIFNIKDNTTEFKGKRLPLNKMIGVIGTAPKDEPIATGVPYDHGGNMDCTMIKEGVSLYLPVNVDGALLAIGDLHAAMGDGEIMGAGLEIAGEVRVKVEVLKDFDYKTPLIEADDKWITLGSRPTMEEASDLAINNMVDLIMKNTDLTLNESGILLSLAGNLKVCQVVDPNFTMRMELDKKYLLK